MNSHVYGPYGGQKTGAHLQQVKVLQRATTIASTERLGFSTLKVYIFKKGLK